MITTTLDANNNIVEMDKLACVIEMVLSLDKLNNTDNLEDGRLSNAQVTSLTLRIMDQKDNGITDGPGMTIVLQIM